MARLACVFGGHWWCMTRRNAMKAPGLAHLHPYAGCDCVCVRCGALWLDSGLPGGHLDEVSDA